MRERLWAVIMAGGSGERLWPLSRRKHPKQTLRLGSSRSLLQVTADRLNRFVPTERIVVVTTKHQAPVVRRQLRQIPERHFLVEPASRNTAAAIGLGTVAVLQEDPDAVMVVAPADHVIRPAAKFERAVQKAVELAVARDGLVCLGVKPTYPATGYGYIDPMGALIQPGGYRVRCFIEKPELKAARQLIRRPGIVWNSGIFCWRGQMIVASLRQWLPRLWAGLEPIRRRWGSSEGKRRLGELYRKLPSVSIDVGVMERSRNVWMVPADFEWDDVGSWNSLGFLHPADSEGNVILGKHIGLNTTGSIVVGDGSHLVATIGVKDLIVVRTADATLVCHKSEAQGVRKMVSMLAGSARLRRHL